MVQPIDYEIKRLGKYLFAVVVPDDYDRAMLFLRAQEYVGSPSSRFRNKSFSLLDYMKWYYNEYGAEEENGFTYPLDWAGFNLSLQKVVKCYESLHPKHFNGYDGIFVNILTDILSQISHTDLKKTYLISYDKEGSDVMRHEIRHACYELNKEYRRLSHSLIRKIPDDIHKQLVFNLRAMGYYRSDIKNELQAYLSTRDWDMPVFAAGIHRTRLKSVHKMFQRDLKKCMLIQP